VTRGPNGDRVTTSLRRRLAALLAVVTVLAVVPTPPPAADAATSGQPGRLLVVAAAGAGEQVRDAARSAGARASLVSPSVVLVEVTEPGRLATLGADLTAHPDVVRVERDQDIEVSRAQPGDDHPLSDDPLLPEQWALRNTGQIVDGRSASPGIDVRAAEAWAWTRGRPAVVVAVIDSGLDTGHPDLQGQLWVNPRASQAREGCAGAVHRGDVHGWDFVASSPDVTDTDGHGTAVASVIAARADDGFGMTGLAPDVRIMALRTFRSTSTGGLSSSLTDIACAVSYAHANGAHVINASWVTYRDSFALRTVIAESTLPVVGAAGNDGYDPTREPTDPVALPAGYGFPHVVGVTSVDPNGEVPRFANTDRQRVHLAAPGTSIVTASLDGAHRRERGTSFSAPFVTAALALARSEAPYATTADLIDTLERTTRPLPSLERRTTTGGMLDAGALVEGIRRPLCRPDRVGPAGFPDVSPTSVHEPAIACLVGLGVIAGRRDGTFRPGELVTRGQLASFLARVVDAAGRLPSAPPDAFRDDDGSVHEPAIDALAALGIVTGRADGRVLPDEPVRRDQLASMLVRTYEVLTDQPVSPSRSWFLDTRDSIHRHTIDAARDLGTVRGTERGRFAPAERARRDHVASFVARLLDALARADVQLSGPRA
jgi:subtilisin family serine protease